MPEKNCPFLTFDSTQRRVSSRGRTWSRVVSSAGRISSGCVKVVVFDGDVQENASESVNAVVIMCLCIVIFLFWVTKIRNILQFRAKGLSLKVYLEISRRCSIGHRDSGDIGYLTNGSARAGLIIMKFNFYGKNC